MNIGDPLRIIRVEPAVVPVPQRERKRTAPAKPARPRKAPIPRHEPDKDPARPAPKKVPAKR